MEKVDIAIIGAGVLGLAAAARLSAEDRTVVVLDAAERYGTATSSRNSEVVHAGIYYPPGSLKSRLCHEGRKRLYDLAAQGSVWVKKTGKFIVAVNGEEVKRLESIKTSAQTAGAEGLRLVDGAYVRSKIPQLKVEAALWSPETGIVDSEDLMGYYHRRAEDRGAIFLFENAVTAASRKAGGYVLAFGKDREELHARFVVNAAGLYSDKIAEMAGIDIDAAGYRIHWCKGHYFRYKKNIAMPHLVYPVPVTHGLGIHLTPDRQGRVRLGPDTKFVDKIDYDVPADLAETFAESVRRYWPDIKARDLDPDTAGIRPKLSAPDEGPKDFVVREEADKDLPGWINLIGVESPGLTASAAVADEVAAMVE